MSATPSGATHDLAVDDLLLRPLDEAWTGSWDPALPEAARHLVTEMAAEPPTCAYVREIAADGSAFWGFSVIAGTGAGASVVTVRPARTDYLGAVSGLYRAAAEAEAENGTDAGREVVATRLRRLGYAGYAPFARDALAAEVERRAAALLSLPQPPDEDTTALELESRLRAAATRLADSQEQAAALGRRAERMGEELRAASDTVSEAATARVDGGPTPDSPDPFAALHAQLDGAVDGLGAAATALAELVSTRSDVRVPVAVATLLAEVVRRRTVEGRHGGAEPPVAALETAAAGLDDALARDLETRRRLAAEVGRCGSALRVSELMLNRCLTLVTAPETLARLEAVGRLLGAGADDLRSMLGRFVDPAEEPGDTGDAAAASLGSLLARVRSASGAVAGS